MDCQRAFPDLRAGSLARQLQGTGVTAICLRPGFVATGFGLNKRGLARVMLALARPRT